MTKTRLTRHEAACIPLARRIRRHHHAARRRLRKICTACGQRWGRHGCAKYLWATDFLSQFSRIVIPDRPDKPRHRHRPDYIAQLAQATGDIAALFRQAHPRPS